MIDFEIQRPDSLDEVRRLLAGDDVRLLAGGQSLLPAMKLGLASCATLVDLNGIGALREIRRDGGALRIGAMATHGAIAADAAVRRELPAVAALAECIGDPAVRSRGTIGGSLANSDPAACWPAAALALGATLHTDRRAIAADDFFRGLYETALEPDEILVSVEFPLVRDAAYRKFRQPASRFAIVGVFVARSPTGIRVAVTGAAACAFRASAIEQALAARWSPVSCLDATVDASNLNEDMHASAAYRAHLVRVLAKRAVEAIDAG